MRCAAQESLGRLPYRFRKGGVRMDRQSHILGQCSHFNRQGAFGDEGFGMRPNYADSEKMLRLGIHDEFGKAVGSSH